MRPRTLSALVAAILGLLALPGGAFAGRYVQVYYISADEPGVVKKDLSYIITPGASQDQAWNNGLARAAEIKQDPSKTALQPSGIRKAWPEVKGEDDDSAASTASAPPSLPPTLPPPAIAKLPPAPKLPSEDPGGLPEKKVPPLDAPGDIKGYSNPLAKTPDPAAASDDLPDVVGTWMTKEALEDARNRSLGDRFTFYKDGTTDIKNTNWMKSGNKLTLTFLETGGKWIFTIKKDRLTLEPYREGYVPYDLFKK